MRILFVVGPLATGILSFLQALTGELAEENEIAVAYGVWPETPEHPEERFDSRVKLIKVNNFTRELNAKKDIAAYSEIKKIAAEFKPDVIHLQSSKAGALGRLAFRGGRYRVFYTPHGYSFLMNGSRLKSAVYKLAERICAKTGSITISSSASEDEITRTLTGACIRIDNGIDTGAIDAMLSEHPPVRPDDRFTVYTSGRICEQKNPELFNEIALALPEVHFVWLRLGESDYKFSAPNVTDTGWLSKEEAMAYAAGADAFLLPSLWEGLSISLLEAMYLKKLCIVSDIPGNLNVISNGVNGFACSSREDYVAAIKKAMADHELRAAMESAAHADIVNTYNLKAMAKKYACAFKNGYVSMYLRNGDEGSACWYRMAQYAGGLRRDGLPVKINNSVTRAQYRRNLDMPAGIKRKLYQGLQYISINRSRRKALRYDIKHRPSHIIIQRETVPIHIPGSTFRLLKKVSESSAVIWDFDDDVRLQNECSLKEFNLLQNKAELITVTSEYLRELIAEESRGKVELLPTTDGFADSLSFEEILASRRESYKNSFIIVWPATFSSLPNLNLITDALETAAERIKQETGKETRLRIVCNRPFEYAGRNVIIDNIFWTRQTAEEELLKAHIGIMPLADVPYSRGKGGFKLIQYMSTGMPVAASAVGYNKSIVKPSFGYLLSNDDIPAWTDALCTLAEDEALWEEMSRNALEEYKKSFSYEANLSFWRNALE